MKSSLRDRSRVLVVDPHGEYGDVAVAVHSPEELASYLRQARGSWRIAYTNDHLEDDFPALCRTVYDLGNVQLIIDEADWWCSPTDITPEYAHLIKYGIGHGGSTPPNSPVHVCSISRFPAEVHRVVTSQAAMLFCFLIVEPRHLEYIARYAGRDFAAALPTLEPLHCAVKSLHLPGPVRILRVDPQTQQVEVASLLTAQDVVG